MSEEEARDDIIEIINSLLQRARRWPPAGAGQTANIADYSYLYNDIPISIYIYIYIIYIYIYIDTYIAI